MSKHDLMSNLLSSHVDASVALKMVLPANAPMRGTGKTATLAMITVQTHAVNKTIIVLMRNSVLLVLSLLCVAV